MKKLFSIVLSVAMLTAMLLPMSVSAVADAVPINASGETVIELENYTQASGDLVVSGPIGAGRWGNPLTGATATGVIWQSNYTSVEGWDTASVVVNVPVTVATAGEYDLTLIAGYRYGPNRIRVNGGELITPTNSTQLAADYLGSVAQGQGYSIYESVATIELVEGANTIQIVPEIRIYNEQSQFCMVLDCLKITPPAPPPTVSGSTTTKFEFEDAPLNNPVYTESLFDSNTANWNSRYTAPLCSGGYYSLYRSKTVEGDTEFSITWQVTAERAGTYDVTVVASAMPSEIRFQANSGAIVTATKGDKVCSGTTATSSCQMPRGCNWNQHVYEYNLQLDLVEGVNTIAFVPSKTSGNVYQMGLDCVTFTPPAPPPTLDVDGITTFEFEDFTTKDVVYSDVIGAVTTLNLADNRNTEYAGPGGEIGYIDTTALTSEAGEGWNEQTLTVAMPVTVEKAGTYKVSLTGFDLGSKYAFRVNNGEVVEATTGAEVVPGGNQIGNSYYYGFRPSRFGAGKTAAHEFEAELYLPAGVNTIYFVPQQYKYSSGTYSKFIIAVDNIKFIGPDAASVVEQAAGTVTAKAFLDDQANNSGKIILALYNGNELVKVANIDANLQKYVEITAQYAGAYTEAKIFVWDNLTNCAPLSAVTPLAIR